MAAPLRGVRKFWPGGITDESLKRRSGIFRKPTMIPIRKAVCDSRYGDFARGSEEEHLEVLLIQRGRPPFSAASSSCRAAL